MTKRNLLWPCEGGLKFFNLFFFPLSSINCHLSGERLKVPFNSFLKRFSDFHLAALFQKSRVEWNFFWWEKIFEHERENERGKFSAEKSFSQHTKKRKTFSCLVLSFISNRKSSSLISCVLNRKKYFLTFFSYFSYIFLFLIFHFSNLK
jgi:hypothetical protein